MSSPAPSPASSRSAARAGDRMAAMASTAPQTFQNHAKYVPLFHFVAVPILSINAVSGIYRAVLHPAWETALAALVGVALLITVFLARSFAIKVQDRVIRLEMRLRLREVLPADLSPRIPELTTGQLV